MSAFSSQIEERPEVPEGTLGRSRTGYPESENSLLRSSSLGHRLNCSVCGLASGAPVFIPRRFATIWFTSVSAASQPNRGSAFLLGTSPRYCDVDGTRDWSRHSNRKRSIFELATTV